MKTAYVLLSICIWHLAACQKLNLRYDEISLECGPDAIPRAGFQWKKILIERSAPDSSNIKAVAIDDDMKLTPLNTSSRSCVSIPHHSDAGWVSIQYISKDRRARVLPLKELQIRNSIELLPYEEQKPSILCPVTGGASTFQVQHSAKVGIKNLLSTANIFYRAEATTKKAKEPRLVKMEGMLKDPSGFEFNLKDGGEGETTLTISLYDLLLANQKWPSLVETCAGEVDRQAPRIALLSGSDTARSPKKMTVNPGQQIEISTSDDQGAQVLSCWMKSSSDRCEQDCVNYLNQSSKIKAPLDGEWKLCYFAVDLAGNRSAVQSASISVVNSERIGRLRGSLSNAEFLMNQGDVFAGLAKVMATQSEINSLSNEEHRNALQKEALLKTLNLSFSALPIAWLSYNQKALRLISSDDAQRVLVADSGKGEDNLETWYWTKADGRDQIADKISGVDKRFAAVYEENSIYKSMAYFSSSQRITLLAAQNTAPVDFPSPANKEQCEPDRMLVDNLSVAIPCNRKLYRYNPTDGVWVELGKWTINSRLELMGTHLLWWDTGSDTLNVYDSESGLKQQFKIPTIERGTTLQRPFYISDSQYFCGVYQTNPILTGLFGNAIGGVRHLRCFSSISQAEAIVDLLVDGRVDYSQQTIAFKQKDGPIQLISLTKNQISEIKQSEQGVLRGISAQNSVLVERSMAEGIVVIAYDIHSLEEKASVYSKFAKSSKLSLNKRAIAIEQNSYFRIVAADSLKQLGILPPRSMSLDFLVVDERIAYAQNRNNSIGMFDLTQSLGQIIRLSSVVRDIQASDSGNALLLSGSDDSNRPFILFKKDSELNFGTMDSAPWWGSSTEDKPEKMFLEPRTGKLVLVQSKKKLLLYDFKTQKILAERTRLGSESVLQVEFCDDQSLLVLYYSGQLVKYSSANFSEIASKNLGSAFIGSSGMNMKLSADHEKIVVTGVAEESYDDARLLLLSSRDLSLAKDINTSSQNWNSRYVQSLSMDPHKNLAILGFYVGKILLWDLNQMNSWEVKGHSSFVMDIGFGAATAYAYSISKQGVMGIYDPTRTINDRFVDTALNNIELSAFVMNPQVHALGDKKNMKLALQSPEGQTLVNLNLPGNLYGLGRSNAELFVELDKELFILHFDPSKLFDDLCQKVSGSLLAAAGESKLKICPAN